MSNYKIMGIVNATPDSFYDGGSENINIAQLLDDGADIIDIGGESSRPGAKPVSVAEEIERITPALHAASGACISLDTRNSETMRVGLDMGVQIINDISALTHDPQSVKVLQDYPQADICLMHMQGNPQTMQDNPDYGDVIADIRAFFEERVRFCEANGIDRTRIILDPGIGFGKTRAHNFEILARLNDLKIEECRMLIGTSRKSFINDKEPDTRLGGSIASVLYALNQGADILRVHDVYETAQAASIWDLISQSRALNTCNK